MHIEVSTKLQAPQFFQPCAANNVLEKFKLVCKIQINHACFALVDYVCMQTSWTDDTDHALLIILSYLHNHGELLPADLAERLQVWCRHGLLCLGTPAADIGTTIQRVCFVMSPA